MTFQHAYWAVFSPVEVADLISGKLLNVKWKQSTDFNCICKNWDV